MHSETDRNVPRSANSFFSNRLANRLLTRKIKYFPSSEKPIRKAITENDFADRAAVFSICVGTHSIAH